MIKARAPDGRDTDGAPDGSETAVAPPDDGSAGGEAEVDGALYPAGVELAADGDPDGRDTDGAPEGREMAVAPPDDGEPDPHCSS